MEKEYLIENYVNKKRSSKEIASALNVSPFTVLYWLNKHNIERRSKAEITRANQQKKINNENNLAAVNPKLAAEWDYQKNTKTPDQYMPKASAIVFWNCNFGHSWCAAIFSRSNGNNCPICAGQRASETNNLTRTSPDLLLDWDYGKNVRQPEYYTPKSNQKVHWRCQTCGHNWKATIATRAVGVGCPSCAGQVATPTNNLAVCFPELLVDWNYTKNKMAPETYLPKAKKSVWWKCHICHYEWEASVVVRSRGFKKCINCYKPKFGFNQSNSAYFYIQQIQTLTDTLIKFGVTNRNPHLRMFEIKKESKHRHTLIAIEHFDDGHYALRLEREIKNKFRKELNPLNLSFNGATETLFKTKLTKVYSFIGGLQWLSDLIWEPQTY